MRLDHKVAIVTGAGRGIGRATAELFSAEGATVYAADIAPADYSAERVVHCSLDIAESEQWNELVAKVVGEHGRIDILVNNAGIVLNYDSLVDVPDKDWEEVIRVNLSGTFYGLRAVLPVMRKQQGSASIVNVCSTVALTGTPIMAPYAASKGGIRAITKNAAIAYAADGVRVNAVFPGVIDTDLLAEVHPAALTAVLGMTPIARTGTSSEIANGVLYLASDEASYVTGTELVIDGGFCAL